MYQSVFFMPHPPIVMEAFHSNERHKAACTVEGMTILAKSIAKIKPETIIFISPHGNSFSNGTCILKEPEIEGDFGSFGRADIRYSKKINQTLTDKIYDAFEERDFISVLMTHKLADTYGVDMALDHGAMVPMSFIDKEYDTYDIVHITPGSTPLQDNYFLGKLIKDVVDDYTKMRPAKIVVVASGDMSHALSDDGPYAFHRSGPLYDEIVKQAINDKNPVELIRLNSRFIEEAAQCGLRSFLMGFGYMDGLEIESKVVSYEGPFGVGYLCGYLESDMVIAKNSVTNNRIGNQTNRVSHIPTIMDIINNRYDIRVSKEDDYIKLARMTIEHYVKTTTKLDFEKVQATASKGLFSESFVTTASNTHLGVFVSIHEDDKLRGCIGTIEPANKNVIEEIIYNAISACSADPRFHPVELSELKKLEIKVDLLYPVEAIASAGELDVDKYGVVVEQGYKRGLLLPNLEGITTVDDQVSIAKQKAGIVKGKFDLYRFEVERHEILE